jgi:hypothetical protein
MYDGPFNHIPRAIQQYWTDKAMELLDLCEDALLVLIFGSSTRDTYAQHLRDTRANYAVIPGPFTGTDQVCNGFMLYRTSSSGERVLYRIVLYVPHPEVFLEARGHNIGRLQRSAAVQERLIDWVNVLLYGYPILPADLSTTVNFRFRCTGLYVPLRVLLSSTTEEGKRALVGCAKDIPRRFLKPNVDSYTKGIPELKNDKAQLMDIMTADGPGLASVRNY